MSYKYRLQASLQRWRAFWRHDVADRPPLVVHFRLEEPETRPEERRERTLADFEAQFDPEQVANQVAQAETQFARRAGFPDDTLPQISAPSGVAVTGWLFGSQVEISAGIPWVWPHLERIDDWRSIDFDAARCRFDQILAIDSILSTLSQGQYAVSSASLDGPADMVVRMLGEEKLALALYEQPVEVESLFAHCTGLWRNFVHAKLQILPTYGGGTATGWDYWVPGKGIALQEDFGQMISPTQFRNMILKYDCQLAEGLDCIWFHVHSGALHMAPEIASSGAFNGIQICNDYPAGPDIEDMLPTLQYIQERGCLILRKFTLDQLDRVIGKLSPQGLAIDIQCTDLRATNDIQTTLMSREQAVQVINWVEGWMKHAN